MVLRPRLLAFFVPLTLPLLLHAQNGAPVTLSGAQVRVEVSSVNGRLKERYQAKEGSRWITIASSAGETEGPVSVHGANGVVLTGALRSVSIEHGALVERLSAGPNEITRTIELTASGPWAHVATRWSLAAGWSCTPWQIASASRVIPTGRTLPRSAASIRTHSTKPR